ncbi:MAG: sirohydrochlorin chelatase [Anaerolineae bacterium]|nr:sirohydrochlorin chelatase [Anaerolineae bacterium]MCB9105900.1 sirohydrochlorin chelatase [Anaerolineales bacterium]
MTNPSAVTTATISLHTAPDAVLLIGHGSRDAAAIAEYNQFATILADHLKLPVHSCFLEFADPPIVEGVRACVEAGANHVVALPLFLGPAGHQKNDVPAILNWAKTEWPQIDFKYGTPLGALPQIIDVLAQRAAEAIDRSPNAIPAAQTALILVGRGSRDPDSNSDVAKAARMLWEGRDYGWVETAFYSLAQPDIETVIERCVKLGARRVVTMPYLLFTGIIRQRLDDRALATQTRYPDIEILTAEHLSTHPGIVEAVLYRYEQVLDGTAAMTCDLCKYRHQMVGFEDEHGLPQTSDHHHGLRGVGHSHSHSHSHHHGPNPPANNLLPPRYQNGEEVSAAPMGSTPFKFKEDGSPAWDEMWTDFCDLALAGGPPHRGNLLEPVLPDDVRANPQAYEAVLTELERGLRMVTGLPVIRSEALGWIGLACSDEEMALWLLRAIVIENITVRREDNVLYFPAGPDFKLEAEIKNIITAVAKTHHYWAEHLNG